MIDSFHAAWSQLNASLRLQLLGLVQEISSFYLLLAFLHAQDLRVYVQLRHFCVHLKMSIIQELPRFKIYVFDCLFWLLFELNWVKSCFGGEIPIWFDERFPFLNAGDNVYSIDILAQKSFQESIFNLLGLRTMSNQRVNNLIFLDQFLLLLRFYRCFKLFSIRCIERMIFIKFHSFVKFFYNLNSSGWTIALAAGRAKATLIPFIVFGSPGVCILYVPYHFSWSITLDNIEVFCSEDSLVAHYFFHGRPCLGIARVVIDLFN